MLFDIFRRIKPDMSYYFCETVRILYNVMLKVPFGLMSAGSENTGPNLVPLKRLLRFMWQWELWSNSLLCLYKKAIHGTLRGRPRGLQGLRQSEEEENQDMEDKTFKDSFRSLMKNYKVLHNIVGPACIFLKQSFVQTLVYNRQHSVSSSLNFSTRVCRLSSPHLGPSSPSSVHHTGPGQTIRSPSSAHAQRDWLLALMENYRADLWSLSLKICHRPECYFPTETSSQ